MKLRGISSNIILYITVFVSLMLFGALSVSAATFVDLGRATNFTVLSHAGITNTGTSSILGNIGTDGVATSIPESFCGQVTGVIYTIAAGGPSCAVINATLLGNAMTDAGNAHTYANNEPTSATDPGALDTCTSGPCQDLAGLTLAPGVYTFTTPVNVKISGDLYLNGGPTDVWVFQIPGTLDVYGTVHMTGGALAKNVFWSVHGSSGTTIYSGSPSATLQGNVLGYAKVAMQVGTTLNGRAISLTESVTMSSSTANYPPANNSPSNLTSITLLPADANVSVGLTKQLVAVGYDQYGVVMAANISFNSTNSSIANVTGSGLVIGQANGSANITAFSGAISSPVSRIIVVNPYNQTLTSMTLLPTKSNVSTAHTKQLAAVGYDQYNNIMSVSFNYSSSNTSAATIDTAGLVTALILGNTTINASSGNISALANITVYNQVLTTMTLLPSTANLTNGSTNQLVPIGFDQYNETMNASFSYNSSNTTVANVSASGIVTARALGTSTINVSNGSISKTMVITVYTPVLATMTLLPTSASVSVGSTQQLTATGYDQNVHIMTVIFAYNSSNVSIATVDSAGLITAVAIGNATITASNGTVNSSMNMTVTAAPPSSGGSGGGGGSCTTTWICSDWSACVNSQQTRTCNKTLKNCNAGLEPSLIQNCALPSSSIATTTTTTYPIETPTTEPSVATPTTTRASQGNNAVTTTTYMIVPKAKPSIWPTIVIYSIAGLIIAGLIVGGYFLFRKPSKK